jgi:hypothetical protein
VTLARTLPILTAGGELEPFYVIAIWAAMFHPADEAARRRFANAVIFGAKFYQVYDAPPPMLTPEQVSELAQAPSLKQMWKAALVRDGYAHAYAALVLRFVLGGAGSIGKAQFLVAELQRVGNRERRAQGLNERVVPTSEKSIRAAWQGYRSVSHLWLAYHDLIALSEAEKAILRARDDWFPWLGRAEAYRRAGIAAGVLDPATTWVAPPGVRLRLPQLAPRLTDEEARILRGYRARRRGVG